MKARTVTEYKDIALLSLCWAWTFSLATLLTFVGPLSAKSIGGSDFFATFTVGIFVIGTAICNLPSTWLFDKYGRYGGFMTGCACLIVGSFICMMSIYGEVLGTLLVGALFLGVGVGLGQFYRFAAIDIATEDHKSWAVTTVLAGGCFAAFLGPTLGIATRDMFEQQYLGCYMIMIVLGGCNVVSVWFVTFPPPIDPEAVLVPDLIRSRASSKARSERLSDDRDRESLSRNPHISMSDVSESSVPQIKEAILLNKPVAPFGKVSDTGSVATGESNGENSGSKRSLLSIVASWGFITPTLINTLAQILMMIVMINCTLELSNRDCDFVYLSLILDLHFFAMFGTGILTGYLLKKFNLFIVISAGTVLMGVSFVIFLSGDTLSHFFVGDFVLGVAWNMLFSSGTVLLSSCYEKHEQNAVQSINEFIINSISGVFSIVSGFILSTFGWQTVILTCLVVYLVAVAVSIAACVSYSYNHGSLMDYGQNKNAFEKDNNSHSKAGNATSGLVSSPSSRVSSVSVGRGNYVHHEDTSVTSIMHGPSSGSEDELIANHDPERDSGNHTMV